MGEHKQYFFQILLALLCVCVVGLSACPPPERYEGTYVAIKDPDSPHPGAVLELKEDSQGVFRSQEQEVSFRWSVRNHEIRFHTKEGGVIIGTIDNDIVTVTLPGGKQMTFRKKLDY